MAGGGKEGPWRKASHPHGIDYRRACGLFTWDYWVVREMLRWACWVEGTLEEGILEAEDADA